MGIPSYSKIHSVKHREAQAMIGRDVVVQEKIDGSQISFGLFGGELKIRSKGVQLDLDAINESHLFFRAVESLRQRAEQMAPGVIYRGEYLAKPKHNSLAYERVPNGNVVLYDVDRGDQDLATDREALLLAAALIDVDVVPELYRGPMLSIEELSGLVKHSSPPLLGGAMREGVVVKCYSMLDSRDKVLMAKLVTDEFREVHRKEWSSSNPNPKEIRDVLGDKYRSEARWRKAVQRMKESGEFTGDMKITGKLLNDVVADIIDEEGDAIKDELFKWALKDMRRHWVRGLPEWLRDVFLVEDCEGGAK